MLVDLRDNEEKRKEAMDALRTSDENRDKVLEDFVRFTCDSLGISGSFISVVDESHQLIRASRMPRQACQTVRR